MSGHLRQRGYVSVRITMALAVAIALGVSFYFFNPQFSAQQVSSEASTSPQVLDEEMQSSQEDGSNLNLPLPIETSSAQDASYAVYFNNKNLNKSGTCDSVYPVYRNVDGNDKEIELLLSLLKGPTDAEKNQGFSSVFSGDASTLVKNLRIEGGVAAIDLADIRSLFSQANADCAKKAFVTSVQDTLYQFPDIHKVTFAIDENPEVFYGMMGLTCDQGAGLCDKRLFQ